jgi:hypothetical protein
LILSVAAVFDHPLRPAARATEVLAPANLLKQVRRRLPLSSAIQMGILRSGDAFVSLSPPALSQRQLYPTNNLLPKSVLLIILSKWLC